MSSAVALKKDRILAVDDTPDNLFLFKLALEQEGYEVCLVDNGLKALETIKQSPPDLILLDVMMPGIDGYEVTKQIRQDRNLPFIPILLISAYQETSVIQGLDAGADEFIRKPIQIDELQARVRSLLRLKQTIDQRENFVSCLTHDLRTPLVAANRMLSLMQQEVFGTITNEMKEAIANINNSNENLLKMLNTLLEVYHYEVGRKILSFIEFDLSELVEEVVVELKPLAAEKNLEIKLEILPNTSIKGDRLELRRVLSNLIGNAIKFTDRGYVAIALQTTDKNVVIKIEDTGIGIPKSEQKAIFQRFQQGNHRRSGKGLGLYLCEQIINTHEGTIEVESEVDKGTTFTIKLPL
ncbi:hybrid sensor histidine kinase/response regulator [Myxosarcina sp. GI1]|uniref:ATP-binding response regulator n=1 Tax=Myxosarcina sp. GI1 TaxID=1541065 RepID=UPI000563EE97|nr:hybrid sensor histidine kinase/response regulator [Myxosarcina sp. GI1]